MLECSNLSCIRGGVPVFAGLSIAVESGSRVLVCGANGAGKTSFLRILSGFIAPSSGSLSYETKTLQYGKSDFNFCFYSGVSGLCRSSLTVNDNLKFWADIFSTTEMLSPIMEYLSISVIKDVRYDCLSSGWKKKVSLAVLPLSGADVWLLDEPFTYLDKETAVLVSGMIAAKANGGGIVIVASHEQLHCNDFTVLNIDDYKSTEHI